MEYFDLRTTVLIVVGHGILPEEEDRPIAYELKRAVNARAGGSEGRAGGGVTGAGVARGGGFWFGCRCRRPRPSDRPGGRSRRDRSRPRAAARAARTPASPD